MPTPSGHAPSPRGREPGVDRERDGRRVALLHRLQEGRDVQAVAVGRDAQLAQVGGVVAVARRVGRIAVVAARGSEVRRGRPAGRAAVRGPRRSRRRASRRRSARPSTRATRPRASWGPAPVRELAVRTDGGRRPRPRGTAPRAPHAIDAQSAACRSLMSTRPPLDLVPAPSATVDSWTPGRTPGILLHAGGPRQPPCRSASR